MAKQERALHVVLGTGQVGPVLAAKLAADGHRVRMVSRSAAPAVPDVQWAQGDITDERFAAEATAGAEVVYHCANPMRYDRWDELLPPLNRAVQHAATRAGARLVVLDNLYMYGLPESGVIDERTPEQPRSKKGELRAKLAEELRAAHARGDLHVSIGRASDFFGPRAARSVTFGESFFASLRRGLPSYALGDPDRRHAYAYIPDVAEGLRLLGEQPEPAGCGKTLSGRLSNDLGSSAALRDLEIQGVFQRSRALHPNPPRSKSTPEESFRSLPDAGTWLLPHAWSGTSNELCALFGQAAGRRARLLRVPNWLVRAAALFGGELSGVPEMLYQWNDTFTVDDSRFTRAFGVSATPIATAVRETLQSYGLEAPILPAQARA